MWISFYRKEEPEYLDPNSIGIFSAQIRKLCEYYRENGYIVESVEIIEKEGARILMKDTPPEKEFVPIQ